MFCNKCGSQINDGMKFCNSCGTPVNPQAPAAPQPQMPPRPRRSAPVEPDQQPEPKKSKKGLIIGIVSAVLVIAIAVFCITAFLAPGFLIKKDEKGGKNKSKDDEQESTSISAQVDETTTTTTTQPPDEEPTVPSTTDELTDPDKAAIKALAEESMKLSLGFNLIDTAENEIVGWENIEDVIDKYFKDQTGKTLVTEAYKTVDENVNAGGSIKDAESLLQHYVSSDNYSNYYEDTYGENFLETAVVTVNDIKSVSPDNAKTYVDMTKDSINKINEKYSLEQPDWDEIEKYATADCTIKISGNGKTESLNGSFVFGLIDGEWKVIYAEKAANSLYSLTFLNSLID